MAKRQRLSSVMVIESGMSDGGIANAWNEIVERKPKMIIGIAEEGQERKEAEFLQICTNSRLIQTGILCMRRHLKESFDNVHAQ